MATKRDFVINYGLQTDKDTTQGAGLNTLYVDSINNRVGIGTTSPTSPLQVQGNTYITGNLTVDGTINATIQTNSISQLNTSVVVSDTGTNGTITFTTDGTAAATISNTQRFGIGTTNPQDKLEINSLNGTDVKLRLATDNSTFNNFSVIRGVRVSNSQSQLEFQVSNGGIQTGLNIAQDGVVTVGQQSSSKLNIIGNSSDQNELGSLDSLLNVYSNTAVSADSGGSISLGGIFNTFGSNRAFGVIKGYKENATTSDAKGYLSFLTHTGSAISEAMRINSSQNIGIGTINPSFKADIAGDARVTSTNKMRFGGTAGTTNFYIQYNSTANSLDFVAG